MSGGQDSESEYIPNRYCSICGWVLRRDGTCGRCKKDYSKPRVMASGWELCLNCGDYSYVEIMQDVWEYEGVIVPTVYHRCHSCGIEFQDYTMDIYDELLGLYMVRERLKRSKNAEESSD